MKILAKFIKICRSLRDDEKPFLVVPIVLSWVIFISILLGMRSSFFNWFQNGWFGFAEFVAWILFLLSPMTIVGLSYFVEFKEEDEEDEEKELSYHDYQRLIGFNKLIQIIDNGDHWVILREDNSELARINKNDSKIHIKGKDDKLILSVPKTNIINFYYVYNLLYLDTMEFEVCIGSLVRGAYEEKISDINTHITECWLKPPESEKIAKLLHDVVLT